MNGNEREWTGTHGNAREGRDADGTWQSNRIADTWNVYFWHSENHPKNSQRVAEWSFIHSNRIWIGTQSLFFGLQLYCYLSGVLLYWSLCYNPDSSDMPSIYALAKDMAVSFPRIALVYLNVNVKSWVSYWFHNDIFQSLALPLPILSLWRACFGKPFRPECERPGTVCRSHSNGEIGWIWPFFLCPAAPGQLTIVSPILLESYYEQGSSPSSCAYYGCYTYCRPGKFYVARSSFPFIFKLFKSYCLIPYLVQEVSTTLFQQTRNNYNL